MNAPIYVIKYFPIETAIWRREHEGKAYYNATTSKQYKNEGDYKSTNSLNAAELLLAAKAMTDAFVWIQRRLSDDYQQSKATDAAPKKAETKWLNGDDPF